ncbi:hypothetical protein ACJIZ3_016945 [Penstemon smallii]|uniref:RING-type E3 ubiquitin transferase n=1 Tax=Penstemon smallii TaxID=265156 RepID=A0ABD3SUI6_9LAMI
MAMSLEDLLSEEGFKRRKAKMMPRTSFGSEGRGMHLNTQRGKNESSSLLPVKTTERTKSDIPRYNSKGEFSTSNSYKGTKPRDSLISLKNERKSRKDSWDDPKRFSISSSKDFQGSEIVEVGVNRPYKEIYLNKVYGHEGNEKNLMNRTSFKNSFLPIEQIQTTLEEETLTTPALDEAAVKAIISILSCYIKRFVNDEDFRTSLRHNSFASLNGSNEGFNTESKVIENLEQAIEITERVAEETATLKELKRASLQLSVITGLNSNDIKDGFTSGIPNLKLSACAHLYLSVIYMVQKKDGISGKHLLQVFCDSPFQARSTLLPDLWERLFLYHFSHVKLWYDKEARLLSDSPNLANQKLLEKAYNEVLDWGTCQLALYYKDWLAEGVEAPSVPLIKIPSFSVRLMSKGGLHGHTSSPASHFSPQPMVSKKLYDEVFRHSHNEFKVEEEDNSPATEEKQLILYSQDSVTSQNFESDGESVHQTELANNEDICEKSPLFSIPKDFLCPLTNLLFVEPVTLETGQTFEREAITNWFDEGSMTCPVSGKTLQYQNVPHTNLVLKRVIDNWKTEHFRQLLALAENVNDNKIIYTIEQLLIVHNQDERLINARRIVSLGGLQFLMRRFHCGNDKEKICILLLLSCCIEADSSCRSDVSRNINRSNLLELLHSEELKSRTNAVLLLTELICFNWRNGAKSFLEGLHYEEITNAMDDLLAYLKTCSLEERPLVAVLLLHIDLLLEAHTSNIYRHEAVDSLTITLERSLCDEKVQKKCCRALLVLGGCFSSSGKLMTEDWILKLSGFLNGPNWDIADNEANDISDKTRVENVESRIEDDDEEEARGKWLVSLSASLIGDGKRSFLEAVAKCLSLGDSDLVRVCLTTVAWLSSSVVSLSETEFQLYAFSILISPLKNCLKYAELVEQRILASFSLLNFSKIPECRVLMMKIAEEISTCLENLADVTWTAKELLHMIISERRRYNI